jgi:hypothetical protein
VRLAELNIGSIYFGVTYEDDAFTRPIVHTYEYLGQTSGVSEAPHLFRFVGADDQVQLGEHDLELILDANGLIELLTKFRDGLPMQERHVS